MSLIGVRTQTTALPVQGSNHSASKPTASWSFFIFIFIFVLEAFFLLLLSCVFNCDHFLCIYFWFKYMKFINSSLQISSGKLFVAFTKYNKAMFVKLSTSFSIPLRANLLRFPFLLVQNIQSPPGNSECTRLAIMTQYLCEVKKKYSLPRQVFVPEPKVLYGNVARSTYKVKSSLQCTRIYWFKNLWVVLALKGNSLIKLNLKSRRPSHILLFFDKNVEAEICKILRSFEEYIRG